MVSPPLMKKETGSTWFCARPVKRNGTACQYIPMPLRYTAGDFRKSVRADLSARRAGTSFGATCEKYCNWRLVRRWGTTRGNTTPVELPEDQCHAGVQFPVRFA